MLKKQSLYMALSLLTMVIACACIILFIGVNNQLAILENSTDTANELSLQIKNQYTHLCILAFALVTIIPVLFFCFTEKSTVAKSETLNDLKTGIYSANKSIELEQYPVEVQLNAIKNDILKERQDSIAKNKLIQRFELESKSKEIQLSKFSHIVTHDLRGPLRSINSFVGLLKKNLEGSLSEREKKHMDFVQEGTVKLNDMINEIVEFTRIEKTLINPSKTNLNQILKQALNQIQEEIDVTNAVITIEQELPTLFCDARKMKSIFLQLILNGMRYTEQNKRPEIIISSFENKNEWQLTISDNGIGIKQEHWQHVFCPFYQLKAIRGQKGIGIGLAICKTYVNLHQGNISILPSKQGTCFAFSISKKLESSLATSTDKATLAKKPKLEPQLN